MASENWDRARGLLNDIEDYNPELAIQLKKRGRQSAIKRLKELLDKSDAMRDEMARTIPAQMEPVNDPLGRMQQEERARMMTQEMANEEISMLYRQM